MTDSTTSPTDGRSETKGKTVLVSGPVLVRSSRNVDTKDRPRNSQVPRLVSSTHPDSSPTHRDVHLLTEGSRHPLHSWSVVRSRHSGVRVSLPYFFLDKVCSSPKDHLRLEPSRTSVQMVSYPSMSAGHTRHTRVRPRTCSSSSGKVQMLTLLLFCCGRTFHPSFSSLHLTFMSVDKILFD